MRNQYLETGLCPRCGRAVNRWVHSYTLGRPDSPPVRSFDRWRHVDDNTLGCDEVPDWGDQVQEFGDTM